MGCALPPFLTDPNLRPGSVFGGAGQRLSIGVELMTSVGLGPTVAVNVRVGDGSETVADGVTVILKVRRSGWVWDCRSASESTWARELALTGSVLAAGRTDRNCS